MIIGDLSNLTGSLARTIQQYSPPSEWIMCELGVFPIFLENDLFKVDKIPGLPFAKARKNLEIGYCKLKSKRRLTLQTFVESFASKLFFFCLVFCFLFLFLFLFCCRNKVQGLLRNENLKR